MTTTLHLFPVSSPQCLFRLPFLSHFPPKAGLALTWSDHLGVGAFAVIGAMNALRLGLPQPIPILCGIMTATFGGACRDLLTNRPVRIFHSMAEIYATSAAAGAVAYCAVRALGAPTPLRILGGVGAAMASRVLAQHHALRLPEWHGPAKGRRVGPSRHGAGGAGTAPPAVVDPIGGTLPVVAAGQRRESDGCAPPPGTK